MEECENNRVKVRKRFCALCRKFVFGHISTHTYRTCFIFGTYARIFNVRYFGVRFVRETYPGVFRCCTCVVIALYYHCVVKL